MGVVNARDFSITKRLAGVAAFLLAVPYAIVKRPIVFPLGIYAALLPFDNLLGLGGVGTLTKYLGILVIITFGANRIIFAEGRLLKPPPVIWSWTLFLLLAGISGLWALSPADTFSSLYTIVGLFLIYFSVGIYPFTKKDYSLLTKLIIAGGVTAAVYTIWTYLQEITLPQSIRASLIVGAERRADPNHLATSLILPLLFSLEWLTQLGGRHRIWGSICVVAIVIAIVLTGSRGGALGAAVAVLLFFWRIGHRIRWRRAVTSLLSVIVLAFIALNFVQLPSELVARFNLGRIFEEGGAGRFPIWHAGFEAFRQQPLPGYGYGNFPYAYDLFRTRVPGAYLPHRVAHNIYLQAFVELGVTGGLLLLFIVWKHWQLIRNLVHRNGVGLSLEAAFIGVVASSATLGTLSYKYFWLTFTLILILANAERRRGLHE